MSSSTDSLKKKVCVTVFLDELFEDVVEGDEEEEEEEEEEERREQKQVSEVIEPVVKIVEKPLPKPSPVNTINDERVNVSPNADAKQSQTQVRPRKYRRESKFSKNRCDSFKSELTKLEYESCFKMDNECCEAIDSIVSSESEFDLEEFLGINKWIVEKAKSSLTDLSECDLSEDFLLSIRPADSSAVNYFPKSRKTSERKLNPHVEPCVVHCNKSTQYEGDDRKKNNNNVKVKDETVFEKAKEKNEEVTAWEKTQKQIQLILAEARNKYQDKESCEGDRVRHYDLKSILEECVKNQERRTEKVAPRASKKESESFTCVLPKNEENLRSQTEEVKRVWSSQKINFWNDGMESDFSESECPHYAKDISLIPIRNESTLCYTVCLNCKESNSGKNRKKSGLLTKNHSDGLSISKRNFRGSSFGSIESKAALLRPKVSKATDQTILGTMLKAEQARKREEESRSENDIQEVSLRNSERKVKGRNKNFADGDSIKKPRNHDSAIIVDLEAKKSLFVRDNVFKHVGEPEVIRNEIIVNRAEIKLHSRDEVESRNPSLQTTATSEAIAEVFFNQKRTESLEKSVTDGESEMVFADSEDFFCRKNSNGQTPPFSILRNPLKDICVVEFEDKLSRSKILRRMKTVEILGDSSLNDMKNISTEVILICENLSNNEVCMEAWQTSASNEKSLNEMKQCYLKDSNNSAMYLLEIPLHFTRAKKNGFSDSDQLCKTSDSD